MKLKQKATIRDCIYAVDRAKNKDFDVLILDSAGRNQVDKEMMNEIKNISKKFKFNETLLVSDAMTGQDAVNTAKAFSEAVDLSDNSNKNRW